MSPASFIIQHGRAQRDSHKRQTRGIIEYFSTGWIKKGDQLNIDLLFSTECLNSFLNPQKRKNIGIKNYPCSLFRRTFYAPGLYSFLNGHAKYK